MIITMMTMMITMMTVMITVDNMMMTMNAMMVSPQYERVPILLRLETDCVRLCQ